MYICEKSRPNNVAINESSSADTVHLSCDAAVEPNYCNGHKIVFMYITVVGQSDSKISYVTS